MHTKINYTIDELALFVIFVAQISLFIGVLFTGDLQRVLLHACFLLMGSIGLYFYTKKRHFRLLKEALEFRVDKLEIPEKIFVRMIGKMITKISLDEGYWLCFVVSSLKEEMPRYRGLIKQNILEDQLAGRPFLDSYVRRVWGKTFDQEEGRRFRLAWLHACAKHGGMVNINYVIKQLYPELEPNLAKLRGKK